MRDLDVRNAVRAKLRSQYGADPKTRLVEEMGVWSGTVRVDLAVINGRLHGIELKSERDTLERLAGQSALYSQVFDRVTLVTAANHLDRASGIVPDWWAITLAAYKRDGRVGLKAVRRGTMNPDLNPTQIARLLWRSELLTVLERHGLDRGFRTRRVEELIGRVVENLSLGSLRREMRDALKSRQDWLGEPIGDP